MDESSRGGVEPPDGGEEAIPAGRFSAWIASAADPERRVHMDVPCGTCTACCRSSYFIHVEPDETDTLRHIPKQLRFPAPGRPKGHQVLGFDERGHCPMLTDAGCSIYEHRPRTCRSYDCRVFTAAGLSPAHDGKLAIAERTDRWRFDVTSEPTAVSDLEAVRRAAAFLEDRRTECLPDAHPLQHGQRAALAIKIHGLFLGTEEPDPAEVRAALDPSGQKGRSSPTAPEPARRASTLQEP